MDVLEAEHDNNRRINSMMCAVGDDGCVWREAFNEHGHCP